MVPKVVVPMNFGKHLIGSPTHSNLKLNTSEGGEVFASSVILSFNSPVIDHMTTSLHMTSVDMLEFGEASVRLFVDAAYSGTAEGITRDTFRDINKIASVFEMTWLAEKCAEYFTEVADSINTPSYEELLYLFEEAGFVFEKLKIKDYLNVTIKKIEMLKWKQEFIDKYLENADRLSTKKLDMVIELAGTEVNCIVRTVTNQLSELLKVLGSSLPLSYEYLLDNSNLYFCKKSERVLFEQLFEVLRELPDDKMRWTLDLHRKSDIEILPNPPISDVSQTDSVKPPRCNTIANLYHNLDMSMTYKQLLDFISSSEEVTNLLMGIEAVCTWNWYREDQYNRYYRYTAAAEHYLVIFMLCARLSEIATRRGWPLLPPEFDSYILLLYTSRHGGAHLPWDKLCIATAKDSRYVVIDCVETCSKPLSLLSKQAKLTFHYKHPSITSCKSPGKCGFILKTVPSDKALWNLELCTEDKDYQNESVHFHDIIRAENMHVFFRQVHGLALRKTSLLSLSWLGWLSDGVARKRNDWENIFSIDGDRSQYFEVLYKLDDRCNSKT